MRKIFLVMSLLCTFSAAAIAETIGIKPLWMKSGGRDDFVMALNYSTDGRYLIYGNMSGTVKVWDMKTGSMIWARSDFTAEMKAYKKASVQPAVCSAVFTGDGKKIIFSNFAPNIEMWDTETWKQIWKTKDVYTASSLTLSPDEKTFAVACIKEIHLFDTATHKKIRTFSGHTESIYDLAFTPDGKNIVSCGYGQDRTIRIWDVNTGRMLSSIVEYTRAVEISPDGKLMATASGGGLPIKIRDFKKLSVIGELNTGGESIWDMKFSRDGKRLYSISYEETLKVWDMESGKLLKEINTKEDKAQKRYHKPFMKLTLHPDGKTAAVGDSKGRVRFWDTETGEEKRIIEGHHSVVPVVKYSPDGKIIASASADNTLKIWDSADGSLVKHILMFTQTNGLCFSPDGRSLAAGGNSRTLFVFDTSTWKLTHKLKGHTKPISRIVYSPDGRQIASSGTENRVILWDAQTGNIMKTIEFKTLVNHIAYSPDGKTLAVAGGGKKIQFFDTETGKEIYIISSSPTVLWLAYSPDGKHISAGCRDSRIRVFDISRRKLVTTLKAHKRSLANVIYSKDGNYLYSTGWDGSVCVWDMKKGRLISRNELTYNSIYELSLHPDGTKLAFGSLDAIVGVLEIKKK